MKEIRPSWVHLAVLALLCLFLSGCWDYVEIEDLEFAFGLGVDRVEPEYVVVVEVIKTSGGGQTAMVEPKVLATKGKSVSSAVNALSNPIGLRAFWAHAYVFLMSEDLAREGILPAIEFIARSRYIRSSTWVFLTKDCTVEEVFKSKPPVANSVSEHLNMIVLMQESVSGFVPFQVWQLSQDLVAEGISAILPTIKLVHERGELVPIVEGTAVFKGDRMVGWLDGRESDVLCILKNLQHRSRFVIETEVGEHGYFPISFELVSNAVEIKPQVKEGKPAVSMAVEMKFSVEEVADAPIDFRDEQMVRSVEAQLANNFTRWIEELLQKIQVEYNADILGLGQLFRRKQPEVWRRFGAEWDEHYRNLEISLDVQTKVLIAGLYSAPLQVR